MVWLLGVRTVWNVSMMAIFRSSWPSANSPSCSMRPLPMHSASTTQQRLSFASSQRCWRRAWTRLNVSSKHRYSTVPLLVAKPQKGSPRAT